MKAPQIIMIVLWTFNITNSLINHGKPKSGRENFWVSLIGTAISYAILKWGGFF